MIRERVVEDRIQSLDRRVGVEISDLSLDEAIEVVKGLVEELEITLEALRSDLASEEHEE